MGITERFQNNATHVYVSIIISTHNRKEELFKTIKNIFMNRSGNYEVIVVSANSKDGTDEEIGERFPGVKLVKAPDVGWGESNNIGTKVAKGNYFYFSGPDMEFEYGWLGEMLQVASQVENLGSIGCVLFREFLNKGEFITGGTNIGFLYLTQKAINLSRNKFELFKHHNEILDVDAVHYPLIPRDVYYKVGGFDPEYFFISDENDLGLRIKRLGLRNVICFGKWTKTDLTPYSEKAFYYWHRNWIRMIVKMNNFFALPMALAYPFAKFTVQLVFHSVKRNKNLRSLILKGIAWNLNHFKETRSSARLKYI